MKSRRKLIISSVALVSILLLTAGAVRAWLLHPSFEEALSGLSEPPAVLVEAADGSVLGWRGELRLPPVSREELPEHLVSAVLAIEDRRFYEHRGLDFWGVARAAWRNLRAGEVMEGGSTITQQLAKVLFLENDRSMRRKLTEAALALRLEAQLSKDEILSRYLNSVYFGGGTVGISAAALAYFGKPAGELTLAESAMLAGLIRAPSRDNPLRDLPQAQARARTVLSAMADARFLSEEQALTAQAAPARPNSAAPSRFGGAWFADWVFTESSGAARPVPGSVRARTTLVPELQKLAEKVVGEHLSGIGGQKNVGQAALVAMTYDGAVVAMVGGKDYSESQFNRAVQARRQAGSAFKLFVYLAALRNGWQISDSIADEPLDINGWRPGNYDGRYRGQVSLEEAFKHSLNIPAVRLAHAVGINEVISAARDLGIDAELESNLGLSLGTSGVSLLDLTGAFASVAAGRSPIEPWAISSLSPMTVQAQSVTPSVRSRQVPLKHQDELLHLLQRVVSEGTGRRAALEGSVAGKTGTSQAHRDGWFIGFTDHLVTGVWVGNDDDSPMRGVTGGDLPAQIWQAFMSEATGLAPVELADLEAQPVALPVAVEDKRGAVQKEDPAPTTAVDSRAPKPAVNPGPQSGAQGNSSGQEEMRSAKKAPDPRTKSKARGKAKEKKSKGGRSKGKGKGKAR